MRRRDFIKLLGGTAATSAWPLPALAQQQTDRVRRIGVLMGYAESDSEARRFADAFVQELQSLGWIEGRNLRLDFRWAVGDIERMRALAKELVELQPEVIVANTTPVTGALQRATRTIPIVFAIVSDPVGAGYVESLARPGGNITGFINVEASMGGKWLELLKEASPGVKRVGILFNPATAPGGGSYFLPAFDTAARSLGVAPLRAPVHNGEDIERAITGLASEPGGGLIAMADGFLLVHRATVIALAARHKLPLVAWTRAWVNDGALFSYGHDNIDSFRRVAPYVDRILRGAKPGELPVQVPTKFELTINLKTAAALGLSLPPSFHLRADEVIE
jgi:putative tryptophan/tyrosine transport system substrate-binding protein